MAKKTIAMEDPTMNKAFFSSVAIPHTDDFNALRYSCRQADWIRECLRETIEDFFPHLKKEEGRIGGLMDICAGNGRLTPMLTEVADAIWSLERNPDLAAHIERLRDE
jgi:hypothetical protein